MMKVLSSGWLPPEVMAAYEGIIELDCYPEKYGISPRAEVLAKVADYDGLLCIGLKADRELIDIARAGRLKAICNFGVGYDNIDWKYATELGIPVINTPIAVREATAELTIALLMNAMRDLGYIERTVRATRKFCGRMFYEGATTIYGKTLGILGFGRIGRSVAQKAKGLGMSIVYYDTFRAAPEVEQAIGATYLPLEDVLKTADAISMHTPYMPETHHFMDAAKFALMKDGAYFVNASRGAVVDEAALVAALKSGKLAGAGLDVFEFEPEISPELFEMENVFLTPHIGSMTWDARIAMAKEALDGEIQALNGQIPVNCVNPEVFQPRPDASVSFGTAPARP